MRIAVAVSGGVDSLCALLLLRRAGHDVLALHGFFLPEQSHPRPGGACDPLPGLEAACRALDIPLHTVDLRVVFQREVMVPFARSYAKGRTPNPCARCNRAVKFGALLDAALALGADKLATGHYARLLPGRRRRRRFWPPRTTGPKIRVIFSAWCPPRACAMPSFPWRTRTRPEAWPW